MSFLAALLLYCEFSIATLFDLSPFLIDLSAEAGDNPFPLSKQLNSSVSPAFLVQ